MTRRTNPTLLAATVVLCMIALGVSLTRMRSADRLSRGATLALRAAQADARRVVELRAVHAAVADRPRPTEDALARTNAVLLAAGVPTSALQSLSPESDRAVTSSTAAGTQQLRRQSLRLVLQPMTLRQLGDLLSAWRDADVPWAIDSIELQHMPTGGRNAAADQYTVRLTIGATYTADSPEGA